MEYLQLAKNDYIDLNVLPLKMSTADCIGEKRVKVECVITINWKFLKKMGIPDHLTCLLRNLYAGQEAAELDMEQQTGSKQEKEYVKAVYCHPAYLTSMQSTS